MRDFDKGFFFFFKIWIILENLLVMSLLDKQGRKCMKSKLF